jgi:hypothetical protein
VRPHTPAQDPFAFLIPMPLSTPAGSPYHVLVNWE